MPDSNKMKRFFTCRDPRSGHLETVAWHPNA